MGNNMPDVDFPMAMVVAFTGNIKSIKFQFYMSLAKRFPFAWKYANIIFDNIQIESQREKNVLMLLKRLSK